MKQKVKKILKVIADICIVLLGNTLFALAVRVFIEPSNLVMAGATGLGIMFEKLNWMPLSLFTLIFNVIMFILGAAILGKKFALTTFISTIYYPFALEAVDYFLPDNIMITQDTMLSAVCSGLLLGIAIGLVFRVGSSTGGMDVPPLVLKKIFNIPLVVSINFFDLSVMLLQIIVNTPENICYGVVNMVIYTIMIDKIVSAGNVRIEVQIISNKNDEISEQILHNLDRGLTLIHGTSGFKRLDQKIILTVVSKREYARLRKLIHSIDEDAFIIADEISEVKGRGFSLDKVYEDSI
ncbi:MAG: YitT family protein [Acutalibacteraceae bacterium]